MPGEYKRCRIPIGCRVTRSKVGGHSLSHFFETLSVHANLMKVSQKRFSALFMPRFWVRHAHHTTLLRWQGVCSSSVQRSFASLVLSVFLQPEHTYDQRRFVRNLITHSRSFLCLQGSNRWACFQSSHHPIGWHFRTRRPHFRHLVSTLNPA